MKKVKLALSKIVSNLPVLHLSQKAYGLITINDKKYFVPGTLPGDVINVYFPESQELESSYRVLKLERIVQPSPLRIKPRCQHQTECNGCPLMPLQYEDQLKIKFEHLIYQFKRIGLSNQLTKIKNIIPAKDIYGYRNRGQFKVNSTSIGYAHPEKKGIIAIDQCPVLTRNCQEFLKEINESLPREDFRPGEDFPWNFIDFNEDTHFNNFSLNKRLPFRQGNSKQNENMKSWMREKIRKLNIDPEDIICELFCGSGNFTEVVSEMGFQKIKAFEVQGEALDELKARKLPGVEVFESDLFKSNAWKSMEHVLNQTRLIILDPPRSGLRYQRAWFKNRPQLKSIIYISCQSESFVRDLAEILKLGFEIVEIVPIDLFPHTLHLEILCLLKKVSS